MAKIYPHHFSVSALSCLCVLKLSESELGHQRRRGNGLTAFIRHSRPAVKCHFETFTIPGHSVADQMDFTGHQCQRLHGDCVRTYNGLRAQLPKLSAGVLVESRIDLAATWIKQGADRRFVNPIS